VLSRPDAVAAAAVDLVVVAAARKHQLVGRARSEQSSAAYRVNDGVVATVYILDMTCV